MSNNSLNTTTTMSNETSNETNDNVSKLTNNESTAYYKMRLRIINDVIVPYLENEANTLSRWTTRCDGIGNYLSVFSKLFTGASSVIAYSVVFYDDRNLAFLAGLTGTIALMLNQLSSYAKKESHNRITLLNNLLTYLKISDIPVQIEPNRDDKIMIDDINYISNYNNSVNV